MKLNDGNKVQGLYNANTTPIDCIFTTGDIVVKGSTLFTCKGDTTLHPSIGDPNWEIYMGDKWKMLNSLAEIESHDPNFTNYIGPQGLSEFIKSRLGGLNSNGRLQILTDSNLIELNSLTQNSVFQLSYDYLVNPSVGPIPFVPNLDSVYIVRTIGELNNQHGLGTTIQEIIEYPREGTYKSWVRFGGDLSLANWSPTRGESFNTDFIQSLDRLVNQYTVSKAAYDGLVNNIHNGNYYSFELVAIGPERNYLRFMEGTESISPTEVTLDPDYHYKVFLRKDIGGGNYKTLSIDITPEDFIYGFNPLSKINYVGTEVYLLKDASGPGVTGWTLVAGTYGISRVLKAKHLIS